jgi:hypothetical protein
MTFFWLDSTSAYSSCRGQVTRVVRTGPSIRLQVHEARSLRIAQSRGMKRGYEIHQRATRPRRKRTAVEGEPGREIPSKQNDLGDGAPCGIPSPRMGALSTKKKNLKRRVRETGSPCFADFFFFKPSFFRRRARVLLAWRRREAKTEESSTAVKARREAAETRRCLVLARGDRRCSAPLEVRPT